MPNYYYLVAQLPSLFMSSELPIRIPAFLRESEKWLSSTDFARLQRVYLRDIGSDSRDLPILADYKNFEYQLLREIGEWRKARRQKQEYKPTLFSAAMVKEGNPLEVEKRLIELRWQRIEELQGEHYFDIEYLLLYYLQLQLLQRLESFNHKLGMEKYKQITEISYE